MRPYACLLILFLHFSSMAPKAHAQEVLLNIGTLNSWMIPFLRKFSLERANIIGAGFGAKGYDIALLQEMFSPWYLKITSNRYFEARPTLVSAPRVPLINSGLAILTHGKVVKKAFKGFTKCSGFQCLAKKGIQFRRIEIESVLIDVYNVHLQPFQKAGAIRNAQLRDLSSFVHKNSNQELPVIIGGDFNIIGESREYQTLLENLYGFKDVWKEARPHDPGHTWNPHANPYARPDPDEDFVQQRVDYLFVRDGKDFKWQILDARLEFTAPVKLGLGKYFGSDHFGVGSSLLLSPR